MGVAIKVIDPEPFNKKEWLGLALGASLILIAPSAPLPLGIVLGFLSLASIYLLFCGLVVLYKTPTRWNKEKDEMTKNLPRNFVIASASVLLVLIIIAII